MSTEQQSTLEQDLETLLEVETFDPPDDFASNAAVSDASIYDEAEADWKGFWEEQACGRIGAPNSLGFGGFSRGSVRERMGFSEGKLLVPADGARRKGKTAPVKAGVDEEMSDLPCIVVKHAGLDDCPMADKDIWFH